jgi:hypothetical protein
MEKIHGDGATSGEGISNNISSTSSSAEVEKKKYGKRLRNGFNIHIGMKKTTSHTY